MGYSKNIYRSFQVVGGDGECHFGAGTTQAPQQKATIAHDPLLDVAKRVFHRLSAPAHHVRSRLQACCHALKSGFVRMAADKALRGTGALRFKRTTGAVAGTRGINHRALVHLLARQRALIGTAPAIAVGVIGERFFLKVRGVVLMVDGAIGGDEGFNLQIVAGLELLAVGITGIRRDGESISLQNHFRGLRHGQ